LTSGDNTYTATVSINQKALAAGDYELRYEATDVSGNISPPLVFPFTVDPDICTVAPPVPQIEAPVCPASATENRITVTGVPTGVTYSPALPLTLAPGDTQTITAIVDADHRLAAGADTSWDRTGGTPLDCDDPSIVPDNPGGPGDPTASGSASPVCGGSFNADADFADAGGLASVKVTLIGPDHVVPIPEDVLDNGSTLTLGDTTYKATLSINQTTLAAGDYILRYEAEDTSANTTTLNLPFTVNPAICTVTPPAPQIEAPVCPASATENRITVTGVPAGVTYSPALPITLAEGDTRTVTAIVDADHRLAAGATTSWDFIGAASLDCTDPSITPGNPGGPGDPSASGSVSPVCAGSFDADADFADAGGLASVKITLIGPDNVIPIPEDVLDNGSTLTLGDTSYQATVTIDQKTLAAGDYILRYEAEDTSANTTTLDLPFTVDPALCTVTPIAPQIEAPTCPASATENQITVTGTPGVIYSPTLPRILAAGQAQTITATVDADHRLAAGADTSWEFTGAAALDCTAPVVQVPGTVPSIGETRDVAGCTGADVVVNADLEDAVGITQWWWWTEAAPTPKATVVPAGAISALFDPPKLKATVTPDLAGLADGTYYVYFAATDAADNRNIGGPLELKIDSTTCIPIIAANDFRYRINPTDPLITIDIARGSSAVGAKSPAGGAVAVTDLIPDAAQWAAIIAAQKAGVTGPYPLTFRAPLPPFVGGAGVTSNEVTIIVTLWKEAPAASPTPPPVAKTPLPFTGAAGLGGVTGWALALIAGGLVLLVARRRRTMQDPAGRHIG
jgi:hypothetical protein